MKKKRKTRSQPSGHIYNAGIMFFNAAELIWREASDHIDQYLYPMIINYSFACELFLKACGASVTYTQITGKMEEGRILEVPEITSRKGHSLVCLFRALSPSVKARLCELFKDETSRDLNPLLNICSDYFVNARYQWEPGRLSNHPYQLGSLRTLAAGLSSVLPKLDIS